MNIVLYEGPRKVGKTFLAKKESEEGKGVYYKFPFTEMTNISKGSDFHGISMGEDVQLLNLIYTGHLNNLIIDRGFISTVVYGIINNRITKKEGFDYLNYIFGKYKILQTPGFVIKVVMSEKQYTRGETNFWDDHNKDSFTMEKSLFLNYFHFIQDKFHKTNIFIIKN